MFFNRTFHPDEANQAFTTGRLLETGAYEYKPTDHHGPTLYYAAAPLQRMFGHSSTAALDGDILRCTPLTFAILALIMTFIAVRKATGKTLSAFFSTALLATCPIFVFYSTDFIQEMLLASFSVMMLWTGVEYLHCGTDATERKAVKPGTWALLFGIAAGLAFATKETSVLSFAAAALAALPHLAMMRRGRMKAHHFLAGHIVLAALGFALTAVMLFSAFCTDWGGVYNAFIAAPLSYLHRAAGDAAAGGADWHVHPWWWYAKLLFAPRQMFSLLFVPIAVYPLAFKFRRCGLPTFLATYSLALFAIYSAIPYKTPWCMLQVVVPLILAFGTLLGEVAVKIRGGGFIAPAAFAIAIAIFLCGDAQICRDPDSRDIPYNYAHASPQVKDLASLVAEKFAKAIAEGGRDKARPSHAACGRDGAQLTTNHYPLTTNHYPLIAVALPPCDTWPFPWYNRALAAHTGYWTGFSALEALAAKGVKPAIVVCPAEEGHLVMPLFQHLNRTRRFEMRPRVRIRAFWSEP